MSLNQLRAMRHQRQRPESVTVVIGSAPKGFDDTPSAVVIDRDLIDLDLSPLVGLPVHVFDLQPDACFCVRVLDALEALNVKPLGICGRIGSCGVSPEHERAMQRYMEALCTRN